MNRSRVSSATPIEALTPPPNVTVAPPPRPRFAGRSAGARPAHHPRTPLQPADGEGLRRLDPPVRHVLQARPLCSGRTGSAELPDGAGDAGSCERVHAEPGVQRAPVPLSRRP